MGDGEKLLNGYGFLLRSDENILELDSIMNVLDATELFALKWLLSCYANFTSRNKEAKQRFFQTCTRRDN